MPSNKGRRLLHCGMRRTRKKILCGYLLDRAQRAPKPCAVVPLLIMKGKYPKGHLDILPFVLVPAELGVWDIIQNLRPVPLAIVVILILFSLFSWTIVFSKGSVFSRARRENRHF